MDNGKQNVSKEFQKLCAKYDVDIRYNIPRTQRNSSTERYNQTLSLVSMRAVRSGAVDSSQSETRRSRRDNRAAPHRSYLGRLDIFRSSRSVPLHVTGTIVSDLQNIEMSQYSDDADLSVNELIINYVRDNRPLWDLRDRRYHDNVLKANFCGPIYLGPSK